MRDFNVIGVMSGTSLDGVDLVYVNFNYDNKWNFKIIRAKTYEYEDRWIEILRDISLELGKKYDYLPYAYSSYCTFIGICCMENEGNTRTNL